LKSETTLRDLVLIGGGHSHVEVLRRLARSTLPGVALTVISRERLTPYSGMLPGLIAGHYSPAEMHIDLAPLCAGAGAQLVAGSVTGLDLSTGVVRHDSGSPIKFDVLSINTGSAPALAAIEGADVVGVPVKPISQFLPRWNVLLEQLVKTRSDARQIAVVGGGAGGVELALAVHYRLVIVENLSGVKIDVLEATDQLLHGYNPAVRRRISRILAARGIRVHTGCRIIAAEPGLLRTDTGADVCARHVLWVTPGAAPPWLAGTGLALDDAGFIRTNASLQSFSHSQVFAAGDVASMDAHALPKAGVFAVRQGPVLAENISRFLQGRRQVPYRPQANYLSLISTGDRRAVASWQSLAAEGGWVWHWKDLIDRRFVRRFSMPLDT
jgi:selenide,water dikinase